MPNVVIDGPILNNIEIKRILVKEVTDALEKAYKINRKAFTVVIRENSPESVGVAGSLLIDRRQQ